MKRVLLQLFSAVTVAILSGGCRLHSVSFDTVPPAAPRELQAFAGDNFAVVSWVENTETDLAGYNVYVGLAPEGSFRLIGATRSKKFVDEGLMNGKTYYYAVSAFDFDGNESPLTVDRVGVTPRPEGRNETLFDYRTNPGSAGYDFSTFTTGPYNDRYTDIFYEYFNGTAYMNVWDDSDIQDMGYTTSLDEIRVAPAHGWSPTKDVRLIAGHTYVVWTWDDHYAKFRVLSLTPQRVVFDWAYQLQERNPYLKRSNDSPSVRAPLNQMRAERR